MQKLIQFVIIFFSINSIFINTVNAESVCTPGCSFNFVFTTGGTLLATQDMVFTYTSGSEINLGETGTINSAVQPAGLDFNAGGTLELFAGESITFDVGGYLKLAPGSDLSSFSYTTRGADSVITAEGESTVITIHGDFSTDGLWVIESPQVIINNDISVSNGVSISNGNALSSTVVGGTGNINTDAFATLDINGVSIENFGGSISISDINVLATNINVTPIIGTVTVLEDLSTLQGIELVAADGKNCVVAVNECVADNGDIYILKDSKLVKQEDASGSLSAILMLVLLMVFVPLTSRKAARASL